MAEVDWTAVHDQYLPLVERVGSRGEFEDLLWEMQGELGASHAYAFGGDFRRPPAYPVGFLGAGPRVESECFGLANHAYRARRSVGFAQSSAADAARGQSSGLRRDHRGEQSGRDARRSLRRNCSCIRRTRKSC